MSGPHEPPALTEGQLRRLSAALGQPAAPSESARAVWCVIGELGSEMAGFATFSAMRLHAASMEVERLHSQDPQHYPVGGRKAKAGTPWARQVLVEHREFVGQGPGDLALHFDDHAKMLALGWRSIVNMPIVVGGRCLGVQNFMGGSDRLDERQVQVARLLAGLGAIAFVLAEQDGAAASHERSAQAGHASPA